MIYNSIVLLNAFAFLVYGLSCLLTTKMKDEFKRFGIPQFRILTGILQVLGGLGCIIGFIWLDQLLFISTIGLAILMFSGIIVRLKIKDALFAAMPALTFFILNLIIAYKTYILL
ncbi:DoxX family protein [Psychroflexus sp. ALD_RP9]|uniref:DoxX family protein n=1 Tax=Psychroflexus sp. ALD_RP9 TaxID=2777186 RepID=UPI001A8DCDF4|nr:DoxX family protein [Psychroflexus sp. ALD_RP9]QSS97060.1 DoxX family protein [Psychroflexus sp. ALD_RP9]